MGKKMRRLLVLAVALFLAVILYDYRMALFAMALLLVFELGVVAYAAIQVLRSEREKNE